MIIEHDIQIKDQKTLSLVRSHVKQNRDLQRAKVVRGSQLFVEKWNVNRLSTMVSKNLIPKAIGKSLSAATASLFLNEDESEKAKGKASGWRKILVETLERLVPKLVHQVLS